MATLCLSLKQTKNKKATTKNWTLQKPQGISSSQEKENKTFKKLNWTVSKASLVLLLHFTNEALTGVLGTLGGMLTAGSLVLAEQ